MAVGIRMPEKGKALLIPTDVGDPEQVEVAAELVEVWT